MSYEEVGWLEVGVVVVVVGLVLFQPLAQVEVCCLEVVWTQLVSVEVVVGSLEVVATLVESLVEVVDVVASQELHLEVATLVLAIQV